MQTTVCQTNDVVDFIAELPGLSIDWNKVFWLAAFTIPLRGPTSCIFGSLYFRMRFGILSSGFATPHDRFFRMGRPVGTGTRRCFLAVIRIGVTTFASTGKNLL